MFEKINILYCGHSRAFSFDGIFFILGRNKDSHNILDEFEYEPDSTLDCGVSCPGMFKKSIFSVVATPASDLKKKKKIKIKIKRKKKNKIKTLCPVTVLVDSQLSDRCPWATCLTLVV